MKFSKILFNTLSKTILASLAGLLISGNVFAQGNAANGETLFTQSKCNQCHTTSVFTRTDRKVNSLEALEAQVRRCDSNLNTNWFDDEIHDVTAYLNLQYYKL